MTNHTSFLKRRCLDLWRSSRHVWRVFLWPFWTMIPYTVSAIAFETCQKLSLHLIRVTCINKLLPKMDKACLNMFKHCRPNKWDIYFINYIVCRNLLPKMIVFCHKNDLERLRCCSSWWPLWRWWQMWHTEWHQQLLRCKLHVSTFTWCSWSALEIVKRLLQCEVTIDAIWLYMIVWSLINYIT